MNRRQTPHFAPKTPGIDVGNASPAKPRGLYRASLEASGSSGFALRHSFGVSANARRRGYGIVAAFAAAALAVTALGEENAGYSPAGGSASAPPIASLN